jgi:AraC-like DNA-binding protein
MKKVREQSYAKRFNKVLDFIDEHMGDALPIKRLARVAHFSVFHFHRQFTHYVGITPTRYVQMARLRRASYRLAFNPLERITQIALEACFENSESFSRAFKHAFGQSPSAFRRDPDWGNLRHRLPRSGDDAGEGISVRYLRFAIQGGAGQRSWDSHQSNPGRALRRRAARGFSRPDRPERLLPVSEMVAAKRGRATRFSSPVPLLEFEERYAGAQITYRRVSSTKVEPSK